MQIKYFSIPVVSLSIPVKEHCYYMFAFQFSLIGCVGVGAMLYQFFPNLVDSHLLTEYEIFISHLVGSCNTKPEIVCNINQHSS